MQREDRQARTLRPKQQHSGEFPRLFVCLIYSRLGIEKLPTRKYKQAQTNKQKSTPPPRIPTVFRQGPGKGRLKKKQ